ncbi:unnamed protein product [Oikopleura dioica]|uniref:Uncharacterized protein n=1 Tax=Oikopleura dioica TaxID=34765 RepID=E4XMV3_OIKDI|nr:unnamed protein product [Oikopleura dioica]
MHKLFFLFYYESNSVLLALLCVTLTKPILYFKSRVRINDNTNYSTTATPALTTLNLSSTTTTRTTTSLTITTSISTTTSGFYPTTKTPAVSTVKSSTSSLTFTTTISTTKSAVYHPTTTSYETTTVSIVETEGECEFMNELLERSICFLDDRYPLKHCHQSDIGYYKLDGICVKPIYMDWTLCGNYLHWQECDNDEAEEPELIAEWCRETNAIV